MMNISNLSSFQKNIVFVLLCPVLLIGSLLYISAMIGVGIYVIAKDAIISFYDFLFVE